MALTKYHLAEPRQRNPDLTMAFCGNLVGPESLAWAVDAVTCARCDRQIAAFKDSMPTKLCDLTAAISRAEDRLRWAEQSLKHARETFEQAVLARNAAYAVIPGWTPDLQAAALA